MSYKYRSQPQRKFHFATMQSKDWYKSLPDEGFHGKFLRDVSELLHRTVFASSLRENPVVRWQEPARLRHILPHQLAEEPISHNDLLQAIKDTITYSVNTGHPYFINQLFSGLDPYGLAGQWVADTLNASIYTYEVAPVFVILEDTVLKEMRRLVGFADGDGTFCPGGSMSNGIAMNLARYHHCPDVKKRGLSNSPRLVAFTSEDAHYSMHKMAALLGIGEDNVCLVNTDESGRMIPNCLEEKITEAVNDGAMPFVVLATAGTTVLGAIDPLPALSDICEKHGLWLHVDAAWGGGLLFSRKYRHKLAGIERADSVTWNPHKLLAAPQQCSALLVRHKNLLRACHSRNASYLFQKDKFYDTTYDTGDKHFQCGRIPDVFKFWLMWKAKGSLGFERHVDSVMSCAEYLTKKVRNHASFELVHDPEFVNVCFWYIPKSLKGATESPDYHKRLHLVAPKIKEQMMRKGSMMIGYQPLRKKPNFFRFVLQNSGVTFHDIDYFVDEIDRLGNNV